MDDLDMTGVDPMRWAEVRRRVAVVKEFLAIPWPTDADRTKHAARLSLSVNQFYALVRAWQEYGRASAIAGSAATKGRKRATGPRHLDADVKKLATDVIAELGPDVTSAGAVAAVRKAAEEKGMKGPSKSTIWNMLMDARRDRTPSIANAGLIVGRCFLRLPVSTDGIIGFPPIMLAVRDGDGAVVAASLAAAGHVTDRMAPVVIEAAGGTDILVEGAYAAPFEITYAGTQRATPYKVRTALSKVLGRGIGNVQIVYQPARAVSPSAVLRNSMDQALTSDDAEKAIKDAIGRHNLSRGQVICTWIE